jgi:FAD/FMN-containing dehydrogenase
VALEKNPQNSYEYEGFIDCLLKDKARGYAFDIKVENKTIVVDFQDDEIQTNLETLNRAKSELTSTQDIDFPSEQIIKLENIFKKVGSRKYLFLNVKNEGFIDQGTARILAELIRKYNLEKSVIVCSLNPFFLYRLRQEDSKILISYDFISGEGDFQEEVLSNFKNWAFLLKSPWCQKQFRRLISPDILGCHASESVKELKELSRTGYPLLIWTVDTVKQAVSLFGHGVWGIYTRYPEKMQVESLQRIEKLRTDASQLEFVRVHDVIYPRSIEEFREQVLRAQKEGKTISIAGAGNSTGGHSLSSGTIVLDTHNYNRIKYDPKTTYVTVESGATWGQVQRELYMQGRAAPIMYSSDTFSVGGSLSVNSHSWQAASAPIISIIREFTLMCADGSIVRCSRDENYDLFKAAIGGYGLFGLVLEVTLETIPNYICHQRLMHFPEHKLLDAFKTQVIDNPRVQIAYGKLSTHRSALLEEAILHIYETDEDPVGMDPKIGDHFSIPKKRSFLHSEVSDIYKRVRWFLEKHLSPFIDKRKIPVNIAINTDPYAFFGKATHKKCLLQKYFIPQHKFEQFKEILKENIQKYDVNVLHLTIRYVKKDSESLLSYAKEDGFAFVVLYAPRVSPKDKIEMDNYINIIINAVIDLNGSFYLCYRPHYTPAQFFKAYPKAKEFFEFKSKIDPTGLFMNNFYHYLMSDS